MEPCTLRDPQMEQLLAAFLASDLCPPYSMNFYQLDGYLRALAAAPGECKNDWKPLIFNDELPQFTSDEQARQVDLWLDQLFAFHRDEIASSLCNLPCGAVYASLPDERVDLEQWARGFLQGYIVREEVWSGAIKWVTNSQPEHKIGSSGFFDELDAILYIVSTVADAKYAVQSGTDSEELGAIFASLPDAMVRASKLKLLLDEIAPSRGEPDKLGIT